MKKIGEILVGARAITEKVRDETLAYMKTHRVTFGTAVLETGAMSEDALLRALSVQTGAPPVGARDLAAIPPDLIRLVPHKLAEKHSALPFRKVGRTLYIAMAHPRDNTGGDEIAFLTGLSVVRHVAISARIAVALEKYYGIPAAAPDKALVARLEGTSLPAPAAAPAEPAPAPVDSPAPVPVVSKLPSGMFKIPLSDGPADPWKLSAGGAAAAPGPAPDDDLVMETRAPAAAKPRSVLEPLDFIPDRSDDEPESAGIPLPEPFQRQGDPRDALKGASRPPQARSARAARAALAPRDEPAATPLSRKLDRAEGTEEVGVAVLESLREKLDTVALFLVQGDRVAGWLVRPEPDAKPKEFSLPFSEPSVFVGLRNTTGFFAGPCPDTAANRRILESIGVRFPAVIGVVPVTIRAKTVLFLLGEAVGGFRSLQIPALRQHASMAAIALEILALRKKLATL